MDAHTYYSPSRAAAYFREFGEPMPEYGRCLTCQEVVEVRTLSYNNLCKECVSKCYNCGAEPLLDTGSPDDVKLSFVEAVGYMACNDCIEEALTQAKKPVASHGELLRREVA